MPQIMGKKDYLNKQVEKKNRSKTSDDLFNL